jgi:hypothetical protein
MIYESSVQSMPPSARYGVQSVESRARTPSFHLLVSLLANVMPESR